MQNTEEKKDALTTIIDGAGILDETKVILHSAFDQFYQQVNEIKAKSNELIVTHESQTETMKQARELRLKLVKVRTQGINEKHKELKSDSLKYTQVLDKIKREATAEIESVESFLEAQEKFAENKEAERIAALKIERTEMLKTVCDNPEMFAAELMPQEAFDNLMNGLRLAKEQKIEAERKDEEERIERERLEQEERERIRIENERLKKEAEERESEIQKEREELSRKKQEEEAHHKAEMKRLSDEKEAERKKFMEQQQKEAAEKKKIEDELKAKQLAEFEAKQKAEQEEESRLSMGDKAKFEELISDLEKLKVKHSFKSAKFKKAHAEIVTLLDKIINHAISK